MATTPIRSRPLAATTLAVAIAASAGALHLPARGGAAQQDPPVLPPVAQPDQEGGPGVVTGEDVAQGVFVRDSAIAVDQFALADRMERLRDWTKAADVYQGVIARYGDRLIADKTDAEGRVYQYASVSRAVQRKLAAWPPEGRQVYEQKFGTPARTLLDRAGDTTPPDPEILQEIVQVYFVTDAGLEAAMLLVDRHLADGNFAAARRLSRELLEMHPGLGDRRPEALLRAAVAAHFLGSRDEASGYVDRIAEDFPDATGIVAGQEQRLADAAAAVLETSLAGGSDAVALGWPTFGGSDDRSRVAPALSSQIAPYVQDLRIPETRPGDRPLNANVRRDLENARQNGQLTGIFPVAYEGALYWSDNVHLFAVGLDSGLPLPGWLDTYGGGGGELPGYTLPGGGFVTPRGAALTPVVTDRHVLANMGLRDERINLVLGQPSVGDARMVCLDRISGAERWSRKPSELDGTLLSDPALQADLAETQFVGSPLVVGDTVWSLAKTDPMRIRQFEQCFLVSLNLEDGRPRTITYLASSSRGDPAARWGGQRTILPEPTSILAYADGLIYVPSDTGALAAVRAADGGVEWLNLYPRIEPDPVRQRLGAARMRRRSVTESQPFHASPVIVEGGRVFFKPPDAQHIFVWGASDGEEVTRIDISELDGDRTLLAVMDQRLVTFGSQGVTCLDWRAVAEGASAREATQWAARVAQREQEDTVLGRPAVTQTQLLLPTPEHLRVYQLNDGRFVATYPTGGAEWADNEEPGNIVTLQDQLIVAGPTRLNVYADSTVIRQRLETQVAENPSDPTPLLRLAQIAFVTGEFDATEQRLRQAEQAASDPAARRDTAESRGAVFASALGFAQTLADRLNNVLAPGSPTPATVDRFFDLAERFAGTPAQHVRVRFARAAFGETEGGAQRRVALLQEILSNAEWRQVPAVPDGRDASAATSETFSPRQAGEVARELLAELIAEAGPQVYEQIEQRAAGELADATAAGDVDALRRLADIYPNSGAAADALAEAARLLREQNRSREASEALRRLAARVDDPIEPWLTLAQIEAKRPGRLGVAAGRMRRAARVAPDAQALPITLPDGRTIQGLTVEQAAFELTEAALAAEAAELPDPSLPNDPRAPIFAEETVVVAGVEHLLTPPAGFERHDRLLARLSDGTLAAFAFGSQEPVWTAPMKADSAESAAWLPDGLLVWGGAQVALLDPETGKQRWHHDAQSLEPGRLLAGRNGHAIVAAGWQPEPGNLAPEENEAAEYDELALEMGRGRRQWRRMQQQRAIEQRAEAQELARLAAFQAAADINQTQALIAEVVPGVGTVAIVLGGRVNAVSGVVVESGEVSWRASLPEGRIVAARGDADYVAVQTEASRDVLSVLSLDDGSLATRRSFETEGVEPLMSFLVTPENELVFVTRRQVAAADLERDPQQTRFAIRSETIGEHDAAFGVAEGGEGRMAVVGGRLLVLADPTRSDRRDALVIDLAEGEPVRFDDPASESRIELFLTAAESAASELEPERQAPRNRQQRLLQQRAARGGRAPTGPGLPGERLWTAGSCVYLTADRGLSAYDLELPGRQWWRLNAPEMRKLDPATNLAVAVAREDLLLFDQPQATPARPVSDRTVRVTSFSRERLDDGRESGYQRHETELTPGAWGLESAVSAWQVLDGGLAVLAESGKLHFLRGGQE